MAAIYTPIWPREYVLTSWTYPVYSEDAFATLALSVESGESYLYEPLEFEVSMSVESGLLTVTRAFHYLDYENTPASMPENYDVTMTVESGDLIIVRAFHYLDYENTSLSMPENYDVTLSVESGDLVVLRAWIYHTQPEEEFDVTLAVVSGILTTI
jgi:hypothetical protein